MTKSMEIVPSGELQKQFGRYSDEAMIRPVGVSRNGRVRFVMVPVDEYERLRRRERVAGRVEDLDDETLAAIRAVEPAPECEDAEARLNTPETGRGHQL
jgi:PHD/YefM family antitoxin component YafN of YafNO toxin-antitoxin module